MNQEEIIKIFEELGALPEGHFVLVSGRHSDRFVSKDMVSTEPEKVRVLANQLRQRHDDWVGKFDVVVAPAAGAILFGGELALSFGVKFAFAESSADGTEMVFGRGYDRIVRGAHIVVAEDIITSGKTVRQMIAAVEKLDGKVFAIGLLWLRGENDLEGYVVDPLVDKKLTTWPADECLLCKEHVPITTEYNKHGREFLDEFGEDPANWPANRTSARPTTE